MVIKSLLQEVSIVSTLKKITFSFILFSSLHSKAQMITTYAGNGSQGIIGDGGSATSAKLSFAFATAVDASGNLYIGMPDAIRKISPSGIITAFAGNGTASYTGDGGQATSASVENVRGLAVDAAGNVYMADQYSAVIRKINTSGVITTIAGVGYRGFSGDGGPATSAQLDQMGHIALDASGNLFIADSWNGRIRKIDGTTGIISTIAGIGSPGYGGYSGDGGPATSAQFSGPSGVTVASNGDLYIADEGNNCIRKIDNISGIITTVAGVGGNWNYGYSGDGGLATAAYLHQPTEVVFDALGNMIIADAQNHVLRKVNTSGIITTIAGNGVATFSGDGNIPANSQFNEPYSICLNAAGNLFIADVNNFRIRKIDFSATPVCPYNLTIAKNIGVNGLVTLTPSITPASSSPTYFGSVSGNPLSNPMTTNNFTTTTSYSLTLPGNGIYNIAITYDDTIAPYHCVAHLNDTILITNSSTPRSFNRRFTLSNIYSCNSNSTDTVYFTDSTRFNYSLTNPLATYTIVTNWGNGSIVTNTVSATNQIMLTSASVVYGSPGVYTVQSIIMGAGIANDTSVQFVNVQQCG
ncbi:MAG: NHL repeat-containing protein, partial [Bacteroidia bacterium]